MKAISGKSRLVSAMRKAYDARIISIAEMTCILACVDSIATDEPVGFRSAYGTFTVDTLIQLCEEGTEL